MKIQYLAKSFLQDYKISYVNDFQDYYILQIFFIPHIIQKNFTTLFSAYTILSPNLIELPIFF